MISIDLRIDKWKKRLLDLGKRNRLINYRETKRSNINITLPNSVELYRRLIINEEALEFAYQVDDEFDDSGENSNPPILRGDLETNQSIKEQQKTLRNLRDKAKTAIEEQGVNTLYLSFGFLKWKESAQSEQIINSPLVLVPVMLTLEAITSPFVLKLHEDEIVINPTLAYKLVNDFGIVLPDIDSQEASLESYLEQIREIALKNKWNVSDEVGLSLLSFLKINMYNDLEQNKDILESHPIIRALSGDTSGVVTLPEEYNHFDHDNQTKPIDTYQVVDADSSQQDAILYAKKGVSFVLQGPPGTGKSQTITNIIAESLADGKKVLFVSEKMAALEVVQKRLSQAGLADFCLTLHSHKANKKQVLSELGRTLTLNRFKLTDEALYQLELLKTERDKLNQYKTELHTPCQPLGKSIYEINGRLAKLQEAPDIIFFLDEIGTTTTEQLNRYKYLVGELSNTIGKMKDDYSENPWRGSNVPNVTHELRHDIETYLKVLVPKLLKLAEASNDSMVHIQLQKEATLRMVNQLIEILQIASASPQIPVDWLGQEDILVLSTQAEACKRLKIEYSVLLEELSPKYEEDYFTLPAKEIHNRFLESMVAIKEKVNISKYPGENEIVQALDSLKELLNSLRNGFVTLQEQQARISILLGTKQVKTLNEMSAIGSLLQAILENPKPTPQWFDTDKLDILKRVASEARSKHEEVKLEISSILTRFDKEILELDCSAMLKRFKVEYTSIFKFLNKNYRADIKLMKSLVLNPAVKMDANTIISLLNELKSISDKKYWISENQQLFVNLFGGYYLKEHTDWNSLDKAVGNFEIIAHYFGMKGIPTGTKEMLLGQCVVEELGAIYDTIITILNKNLEIIATDDLDVSRLSEKPTMDNFVDLIDSVMLDLEKAEEEFDKIKRYNKTVATYSDLMMNLSKLVKLQEIAMEIEAQSEKLKSDYQFLFNGIETDWDKILASLSWTNAFKKLQEEHQFSPTFVELVCQDKNFVDELGRRFHTINQLYNDVSPELNWYLALFDEKDELLDTILRQLVIRIESSYNNLSALEEWIDYRGCRLKCKEAGLSDFIAKIETQKLSSGFIIPAFFKRFYRLWLDATIPRYPEIQSFRRRAHEDTIREFAKLDLTQLAISRTRVKERLVAKLPDLNHFTSAVDEVGILKRELNKQRKIMPLRRLFKAIPNLLMTLKPCLMMSPLSVSLFLEANNYSFDVVIFDERHRSVQKMLLEPL